MLRYHVVGFEKCDCCSDQYYFFVSQTYQQNTVYSPYSVTSKVAAICELTSQKARGAVSSSEYEFYIKRIGESDLPDMPPGELEEVRLSQRHAYAGYAHDLAVKMVHVEVLDQTLRVIG